ncbi:DNA polymerase III subunit delta [Robiginitomaculum antarcticum]|uniref:DNA polymerase III subunit delta n=1 Tax=Robiginitomaculum antarcticum TaxID=437507 RepID=UPI00039CBCC4|nr:DNA polymerase III subunit delta [Robiginitomaculum antarcticum]
MKLTGSRADKFCASPNSDVFGALLYGPDRGLVHERSAALAKAFVPDADEAFGQTVLTADDLSSDFGKLSDEMSALSMFGDTRLIRVRLDHERQGGALSKLIKHLDTNPEIIAARLIIEAGDMQSRSATRKAFEAAGHFAAIPCYEPSARDLENMVRDGLGAAGEHGVGIGRDALAAWLPLLEGNSALAKGEIDKMALYKGYGASEGESVTVDDIEVLAAGAQGASLDDIIYPACSGQVGLADNAYARAIDANMNPAMILRSLQRHLTRLHAAVLAMDTGRSASEAMRSLRPPVFAMRQRDFERQMRLWPAGALSKVLAQSLETDRAVKTAGSPAASLTGRFILALSMQAARRAR